MSEEHRQTQPNSIVQSSGKSSRSEERLRLWGRIFEHASWGVALCLGEGNRLDLINPAFARIHGYDVAQLEGRSLFDLVAPEHRAEVRERLDDVDHDGRGTYEIFHVRKSGSRVRVRVDLSFVTNGRGIAFRILNVQDVTERRQLEDQLRQAQKMEAIGRLAGGIAHDFNNILTAIFGYAEIALARLSDDGGARADVLEIQRAAERAGRLTGQLLAFSRRQVLAPRMIEMNELLADMGAMLKRLLRADIVLRLIYDPDKVCVAADRGQLEQVVLNLAVNARDAMQKGGVLTIGVKRESISQEREVGSLAPGDYAVLEVRDTGVGMMSEPLQHIFEPFFTTKPRGEGTGLGLATVYGIVKQSGGEITVDSKPGGGTRFRVYLPLADADADADSLRRSALKRGSETVLVVEDDAIVRRLAVRALRQCGYRVLEATDGEHALRLNETEERDIHLLLTDVVMPGMNGKDLAYEIRLRRPQIRVLFISGYIDAIVGRDPHQDSDPLLEKPFTPDMLATKVRSLLDDQKPC